MLGESMMSDKVYMVDFVGDVRLGRLSGQLLSTHVHENSEATSIQYHK